jgi:cytosine/adenosine deaminase-related metal-dependent hydrolase
MAPVPATKKDKEMAGTQDDNTTIYRADWVLPIASPPISDGGVAVSGTKIAAVGAFPEVSRDFPGAEVVAFHHTILLPGFVNCHSHVEYAVFRGLLDNRNFGPWILDFIDLRNKLAHDDLLVSSRLGVAECVSSGITTLADSMYSGASLEVINQAGLRARAYQEVFGIDDNLLGEKLAEYTQLLDRLEQQAGDLVEIGIFPHATYTVSARLYQALGDLARERKMKLATHLAESGPETKYIKSGTGMLALDLREKVGWDRISHEPFGVSPVKYLQQWNVYGPEMLAVHCVRVSSRDVEILAKEGVAIAHCPKSNAKLACGIAPLPEFLSAGINVGIGTDSPASSNIMDMFGEMRTSIFLHRGVNRDVDVLSTEDCVQMATLGGARALGMDGRIGSLEPGKQADLIAVDMEHSHLTPIYDPYSALVYGANQEDVFFTMVAGRPIYDRKVLTTLDFDKINSDALSVKEKLYS